MDVGQARRHASLVVAGGRRSLQEVQRSIRPSGRRRMPPRGGADPGGPSPPAGRSPSCCRARTPAAASPSARNARRAFRDLGMLHALNLPSPAVCARCIEIKLRGAIAALPRERSRLTSKAPVMIAAARPPPQRLFGLHRMSLALSSLDGRTMSREHTWRCALRRTIAAPNPALRISRK